MSLSRIWRRASCRANGFSDIDAFLDGPVAPPATSTAKSAALPRSEASESNSSPSRDSPCKLDSCACRPASAPRSASGPPTSTSTSGRESLTVPLRTTHPISELHLGAVEGDFEVVVCELVLKGADVNGAVSLANGNHDLVDGVTPLYLAAQAGHTEMCRMLLRRGADPRARSVVVRTGQSFTPADIALSQGHLRIWWMLTRAMKRLKPDTRNNLQRARSAGSTAPPPPLPQPPPLLLQAYSS